MDRSHVADEQVGRLADHLAACRGSILREWRESVKEDPEIGTADALPRRQFVDHIPAVLDAIERRFRALPCCKSECARGARKQDAAVHGLVRGQLGCDLREVTREWGHVGLCIGDELEAYAKTPPRAGTTGDAARAHRTR